MILNTWLRTLKRTFWTHLSRECTELGMFGISIVSPASTLTNNPNKLRKKLTLTTTMLKKSVGTKESKGFVLVQQIKFSMLSLFIHQMLGKINSSASLVSGQLHQIQFSPPPHPTQYGLYTIPLNHTHIPESKKPTKSYCCIHYLAYLSDCHANGWAIRGASRTVHLGAQKTSKSKIPSQTLHRTVCQGSVFIWY